MTGVKENSVAYEGEVSDSRAERTVLLIAVVISSLEA